MSIRRSKSNRSKSNKPNKSKNRSSKKLTRNDIIRGEKRKLSKLLDNLKANNSHVDFSAEALQERRLVTFDEKGYVVGLRINDHHLSYVPSLGDFPHLEYLNLARNELTSIPSDIKNMEKLITIEMNDNQLLGIQRDAFENLSKLEHINVKNNELDRMGNMDHLMELRRLDVSNNSRLTNLPPMHEDVILYKLSVNRTDIDTLPVGLKLDNVLFLDGNPHLYKKLKKERQLDDIPVGTFRWYEADRQVKAERVINESLRTKWMKHHFRPLDRWVSDARWENSKDNDGRNLQDQPF